MWTYNHSDELYHYGIKGMKWGKRTARRRDETTNHQRVQTKKEAVTTARLAYKNNKNSHTKNEYKRSKKDYVREAKKRNENYTKGQQKVDTVLQGNKYVNTFMNKNKNMSLGKARAITYAGLATSAVMGRIMVNAVIKKAGE